MPDAPDGIEYKDPGIMESQIFTVLTKRFKSGRASFSKFGATCLSKICAIKVQEGIVEIEKVESEIPIDNSTEEYMQELKEEIKKVRKALIVDPRENLDNEKKYNINIDMKSPVLEALRLTPISELDYIY